MASKPWKAGDFIVEYTGELVTSGEGRRREREKQRCGKVDDCFTFFFSHG